MVNIFNLTEATPKVYAVDYH